MLAVRNILVPRDFSPVSNRALYYGVALAARMEATLHVLHVTDDHGDLYPTSDFDTIRAELRRAGVVSGEALDAVQIFGAERNEGGVTETITQFAAEKTSDLIVLGTRSRDAVNRAVIGSVAENVVRQADRPVLTVHGSGRDKVPGSLPLKRVLVPVDFSTHAFEAARVAMEWTKFHSAQVDLLHVIEENLFSTGALGRRSFGAGAVSERKKKVRDKLITFAKKVGALSVPAKVHLETGAVAASIVELAESREADLVVVSSRGRTGVKRFLRGSVVDKVIRRVSCPVLTVKAYGRSIRALAS